MPCQHLKQKKYYKKKTLKKINKISKIQNNNNNCERVKDHFLYTHNSIKT